MDDDFRTAEEFKTKCGYEIGGTWYPRVTKIVSIKAKPALYRYYASAPSYAAAQSVTERSAEEGTMIHACAEAILLGQKMDPPEPVRPSVEAFLDFLGRTPIEVRPELVERRIVSPEHRYAGTVDAVARINGKLGVLDIKTSQAVYRDYNLQTAAYMDALKGEFEDLSTRWILRLDQSQLCYRCNATRRTKGGREKIRRNGGSFTCAPASHDWSEPKGIAALHEFPTWQGDFEAFLGAKRLWEWEHEVWLREIAYL